MLLIINICNFDNLFLLFGIVELNEIFKWNVYKFKYLYYILIYLFGICFVNVGRFYSKL